MDEQECISHRGNADEVVGLSDTGLAVVESRSKHHWTGRHSAGGVLHLAV